MEWGNLEHPGWGALKLPTTQLAPRVSVWVGTQALHVPLCLSTTSGAVSSWFQMEDIPCMFQKPVSGNLAQNGHHKSLSPRKPYDACMVPCSGNARDSSQILIWGGAGLHTQEPQSDRARHRCSQPTRTRKGFENSQRGQPGWWRGKGGHGMVLDSYGGGHRWVVAAGERVMGRDRGVLKGI